MLTNRTHKGIFRELDYIRPGKGPWKQMRATSGVRWKLFSETNELGSHLWTTYVKKELKVLMIIDGI